MRYQAWLFMPVLALALSIIMRGEGWRVALFELRGPRRVAELTLLTLNVGFYLGVDFLVIGGPEPATWDWETMGLIFATDLPMALLAAWRHVPRADAGEAPRCPGQVIMETSQGSDVSPGLARERRKHVVSQCCSQRVTSSLAGSSSRSDLLSLLTFFSMRLAGHWVGSLPDSWETKDKGAPRGKACSAY